METRRGLFIKMRLRISRIRSSTVVEQGKGTRSFHLGPISTTILRLALSSSTGAGSIVSDSNRCRSDSAARSTFFSSCRRYLVLEIFFSVFSSMTPKVTCLAGGRNAAGTALLAVEEPGGFRMDFNCAGASAVKGLRSTPANRPRAGVGRREMNDYRRDKVRFKSVEGAAAIWKRMWYNSHSMMSMVRVRSLGSELR